MSDDLPIVACPLLISEGFVMSIVRIGLAETKNFSDGYDAIFGKKKPAAKKPAAKVKTPAVKKAKKK